MAKTKEIKTRALNPPVNKEQQMNSFDIHRQKMAKYRTWSFVIWIIGLMLILAKWGKFSW